MRNHPKDLNEYEQRFEALNSTKAERNEDWPDITPLQMGEKIHEISKDNLRME